MFRLSCFFILFSFINSFAQSVYIVDRLTDNNSISGEGLGNSGDLRYCLSMAGTNLESTINFGVEGTFLLADSLPVINTNISIDGGDKTIIIDAQRQSRIFTFAMNSNIKLRNINLYNGYARYPSSGGAAIVNSGNLSIDGCNFVLNESEDAGGAITNMALGNLEVNRCLFSANRATGFGGAIYNFGGNMTVNGCNFEHDTSSTSGGAIFDFGESIITNSNFAENGSYYGGSAYSAENDSVTHQIVNCVFYNNGSNYASNIAAIYNASKSILINNSIYSHYEGGIFIDNSFSSEVSMVMINNIVAVESEGNTSIEGSISGAAFNNIMAGDSNNSNISDGLDGNVVNSTLAGSLFYSTENQFFRYGLSLAAYSPAIDGGLISIPGFSIPQTDINDTLRDNKPDIGAVEFKTLDQTISFEPIEDKIYTDPPFEITATAPSKMPLIISISGLVFSSANTVTIVGAGVITVTASVSGDRYYKSASDTFFINVFKADQFIPDIAELTDVTLTVDILSFTLYENASSGLPINYELQTDSIGKTAALSGNVLNIFGAGSVVLTATQNGNENYNAVSQSVSFMVFKYNSVTGINNTTTGVNTFTGNTSLPGTNTSTGTNTTTGINESIVFENISIYPNPNNGQFYIQSVFPIRVEIFNLLGIKIDEISFVNEKQIKLDSKGLVLLKISTQEKTIYKKVLVE